MKKVLFAFALLLGLSNSVWAYDFSAVAPSGQLLYYSFSDDGALFVRFPNDLHGIVDNNAIEWYRIVDNDVVECNPWDGYTKPTGNLVIPDSVTYNGTVYVVRGIDDFAFYGCDGLASITIPSTINSIGVNAFGNCINLSTVNYNATFAEFYLWGDYTDVYNEYHQAPFYGCNNLNTVNFGSNVTRIPEYMFCYCLQLNSIELPSSLLSVGNYAFYACPMLPSMTIPNSVVSIDNKAFSFVNHIVYNGTLSGAPWGAKVMNGYVDDNGFVYASSSTINTLKGYIGNQSTITIPNAVTKIDSYAFLFNPKIININFLNNVNTIGKYAFYSCSGLQSITLPNQLTTIDTALFSYCRSLHIVNIPSSVQSIRKDAFSYCDSIDTCYFNANNCSFDYVFYTNGYVFCSATGLRPRNLVFGNNVSTIPFDAFRSGIDNNNNYIYRYDYRNIRSITFGENVQSIGDRCFGFTAESFINLIFKGSNPPSFGSEVWYPYYEENINNTTIVSVPCGSTSQYLSRLGNIFSHIEEYTPSFAALSSNDNWGIVQILSMPTCSTPAALNAVPASGYRFDHWSTGSTQNPYSLTVTTDTVITAYFVSEGGTEGIEDINADGVNIYVKDGRIVVDGTTEEYWVYDITGRMVAHSHSAEEASLLPSGVYLVKVGLRPAYKVVVR